MIGLSIATLCACSRPHLLDVSLHKNREASAPVARYFIGGDARNDRAGVLPWALKEAKQRSARGFIFLGDMELTPQLDARFERELVELDPIQFFPVLGNHEIKLFGVVGLEKEEAESRFQAHFLGTKRTPVRSWFSDRVAYSRDLDGGVHFVALDNVSQRGFGAEQLERLAEDLTAARRNAATRYVIVGMHKALAHNPATTHSMDEDGENGVNDSNAALKLFQEAHVTAIFASHVHEYVTFEQGGIPTYVTGGLGAPLARSSSSDAVVLRHHVLQLDVLDSRLDVTFVPFEGPAVVAESDEDEGKE
jgi:hypothetical protein